MNVEKRLPMEGIRVLDFGMAAVGPLSATYLGVLGADVIKIEQPTGDVVRRGSGATMQGMGCTFIGNNYTKRGMMLDLKDETDLGIAFKLVASADVALDNFRERDIMVRLGLGYDVMSKLNPRIIYLQASAYGPVGPLKGMLSNEWATQAAAAYTSLNGKLGGQPEFLRGSAHLDWNGAMLNCLGILAALHVRNKTGRGVFMETSQLQSTVTGGFTRLAEYFASGESPKPMGSSRPNIVPDQAFPTALGYISVSVVHNGIWSRLCQALDMPELTDDPRFATNQDRVDNRGELIPILEDRLMKRAAWQWVETLRRHRVPCGEYKYDKPRSHLAMKHPQVAANHMMDTIESAWGPVNYSTGHWRFSRARTKVDRPAPVFNQHREEIVRELEEKASSNGGSSSQRRDGR